MKKECVNVTGVNFNIVYKTAMNGFDFFFLNISSCQFRSLWFRIYNLFTTFGFTCDASRI